MRQISILFALFFSCYAADAQISLSALSHQQFTPNTDDTSGVFCRTFYNPWRDKFYVVYAGRPANQPGGMKYFAWHEYDTSFNPTGAHGTLDGFVSGGDFAMVMVDSNYYHVTLASGSWSYKLSKYDQDFNLLDTVTFALDSSDSGADMLMNYTNGRLVIGAFHQAGVKHPTMPMQSPSWNPTMHKWEYDLNLNAVAAPQYLNEVFTTWGASCIYNNNQYHIITMRKWPDFTFNVYRYDGNWNFIDTVNLSNDGQWSQGVVWDGNYYYVAYHSGNEHRSGNITVGIYDGTWSLVYDTTITNNPVFVLNSSPLLGTVEHNANRPFITKVGDTLYVSYDEDDYTLTSYGPPHLYAEGKRWQANVTALKIDYPTAVKEQPAESVISIYPNPVSDKFVVETTKPLAAGDLIVVNSMGQVVTEVRELRGNRFIITTANLLCGVYFVSIVDNKKMVYRGKLLKAE